MADKPDYFNTQYDVCILEWYKHHPGGDVIVYVCDPQEAETHRQRFENELEEEFVDSVTYHIDTFEAMEVFDASIEKQIQRLVDDVEEYIAKSKAKEGTSPFYPEGMTVPHPPVSRQSQGESVVDGMCAVLQERGYRTRFDQRGAHRLIVEWGD